jgi:C1A family cysteine protease
MAVATANPTMRKLLLALLFASTPVISACGGDDGPTPFDEDAPPLSSEEDVLGGPADAPDDSKSDEVFPAQWNEIKTTQSPVKSQGSRGVCSIFATTAQVENLYITAGMANPDFSEQYMQWSVKNQVGAFQNTEGSNGGSNLDSVVDYGTVEEAAWPYQSQPWNATNDPECNGGMNLPTKCYTNGEPPQSAVDARKWRLPSSRWVSSSPNSIKHHLVQKKTGAVVGLTFFYQSWNHRSSTIPVDAEYWRQGYVTYPNAKDKTESATHRAGHAILIIGWDDNLEVQMRDETGAYLTNTDGTPKVEKGFWIIKNSWGTAGFGINHPNGAGYGYLSQKYVQEYGNTVIAEVPDLGVQTETACDDGSDNDGDNAIDCDDTDCTASPACAPDPTVMTYTASPNASIPDNDPTGVSSTIAVTDAGTVGAVKVTVAIDHTYRGDLTVSLAHGSTTQNVIAEQGGSEDDIRATFDVAGFTAAALAGDWTLKVVDGAGLDVGVLETWTLEIGVN